MTRGNELARDARGRTLAGKSASGVTSNGAPDLSPCPFCGGLQPEYRSIELDLNIVLHEVRCTTCGCTGASGLDKIAAAKSWNRRASPSTAEAASVMLGALEEVRSIIKDAGMVGFNHAAGNWPERLFASQQITKAAVDQAKLAGIKGKD